MDRPHREPAARAHPGPQQRLTRDPQDGARCAGFNCGSGPAHGAWSCTSPGAGPASAARGRIGAMTRTRYYTAMSLDGYLADADNSLDWLLTLSDAGTEGGFGSFLDGIGAMAMG